jgi:hypothetical protein
MLTYRHLYRSQATSSLITERRFPAIRVVSEAFIQDFVLVFDSKLRSVCGDSVKRGLHPRSNYNSAPTHHLSPEVQPSCPWRTIATTPRSSTTPVTDHQAHA